MDIKFIIDFIKKLLNRLCGGKPKRSGKEILKSHGRQTTTYMPPKIYSPPVEVEVTEKISVEPPQEKFVIDIKDSASLENFLRKLNNLKTFEEFLPLQWVSVRLERVRSALKKISPNPNFDDDELNFKLAKTVRDVAENMLDIFQNSNSSRDLNDISRKRLKNLVENYLENIGVEKENFSQGDSFDDWAKLNMINSFDTITTDNPALNGKIAEVEIQPHVIYYIGDAGDVEKINFGGLCKVYKFKI